MSKKIEIERTATTLRLSREFLKEVKMRCVREDRTFNDFVVGLIERDMQRWNAKRR